MDNGCLFENLLYSILPSVTLFCLLVQFVFSLRYPWFLFGKTFSTKQRSGKIKCKVWFRNPYNKEEDVVDNPPNLEIIEMNDVEDFRNILLDHNLPTDQDIILDKPWHAAITVASPRFLRCSWFMKKHLGCHHFVITEINYTYPREETSATVSERHQVFGDYKLKTYEYDESWCSFPLLKTCQCCNGQVQEKERNLTRLFTNRGSLFLWRSETSATKETVNQRYAMLKDEVSWELILNNCEHFVNFLLHGKHVSYQIRYVPLAKSIFARSLAGLLRGHLSTTGFLRLATMVVAHGCNAVAMYFLTVQEKYQAMWLVVAGLEMFVLIFTDFLYFRQILRRSVNLPEAFIEILHSLMFFFLSTSSFSLGTLTGHFHPVCDPCIMNEIFLSVVFTVFALCCVHPMLSGTIDYLFHKGNRKDLKLKITYESDNFIDTYDVKRVNMNSVIFGIIVIIIIGLILFVSPLFILINFDELEDIFFFNVLTNCTWFANSA